MMRRFGRWTFNGLIVLSLLLCLGAVVAWVKGYSARPLEWDHTTVGEGSDGRLRVSSTRGVVEYWWSSEDILGPDETPEPPAPVRYGSWPRLGVTYIYNTNSKEASRYRSCYLMIHLPNWMPVVLTLTLPLGWLLMGRRKSAGHNRCVRCSYDLTANESGVCPECGTKVEAAEVGVH